MTISSYSDLCNTDATLRPYQQKAKREIFGAWDEVDSVMFQMPTGTGKTRLFTSMISDINEYSKQRREAVKILIVAHRTELIDQIDESLTRYRVPHNVIAGGRERNYKYPVNIASIQTLTHPNNMREARRLNVQFVIIDEAHHALAASYKKLWKMYPGAKRLGVTATPWRMNHQSFTDLFDRLVLSMPIKEFIRRGYLAPYKYFSLQGDSDIQKTIDGIELDRFGEYKESSMEEKMDIGSIRAQLLDSYLSLAEGKKGIIYAINIVHARHICEEYSRAGYRAVSIDSKTPAAERKELVGKFKRGEIDIIVNVDIFSEGFDCPDIEFIQLARPTRSLVKYLQQVGRGLRTTANKENCVILDNVGMYARFGLPDARRHWKHHFLGKDVDEEPRKLVAKGTGRHRYVDLSEGTEDMVLIQDVDDENVDSVDVHGDAGTEDVEVFDPTPLLQRNGYEDENFIFWFKEDKRIYEAYIQDDTYFIISELSVDEQQHVVHRVRVGKIPMESWMFWQMEREKVDNLKSVAHYGANYTVFHYRVQDTDGFRKDKYFDYKGREILAPAVVEEKYKRAKQAGPLHDYIDVPVSKAAFDVELLLKSKKMAVNRTIKGVPKLIALLPVTSNFGVKYYGLNAQSIHLFRTNKMGKGEYNRLKNYQSDSVRIVRSDYKSITVRCNEKGTDCLYKYDLNGKLLRMTTIADGDDKTMNVPSDSDIDKIGHVFDSKATSYKYFWFLSILQLYKENRQPSLAFESIVVRMIANAWRYVYAEGGEFPKLDQIPRYVEEVKERTPLGRYSDGKYVEDVVREYYRKAKLGVWLVPLLKNVPYRFLSPWIPFTSNEDVVAKSNAEDSRCLYSLHEDRIEINPLWREYLRENYDTLLEHTEQGLREYLKCGG